MHKLTFFLVPFYFLAQLIVALKISRRIKPDLIYSHWFTPQGITAYIVSIIYKIPFTFTTHAQDEFRTTGRQTTEFNDHMGTLSGYNKSTATVLDDIKSIQYCFDL